MKQWGATLIFIGLGSFVLPMIGLQFRLLNLFGGSPAAGMFVAAVGGVLLAVGFMKERAQISPVAKPRDSGGQRQVTMDRAVSPPQSQPIVAGIRCAACGAENTQGDQFCGSCGAALVSASRPGAPSCVRCGTPLPPDEPFCGECGEVVFVQALPSQPQTRVAQTSTTAPRSRRVAAVLGAIILLVVTALYYTKQEPTPPNNQPAPQSTARPLQQSKEQRGVPPAPRVGPDQNVRTSNNQEAVNPPGGVVVSPGKYPRSVPPAPRLGPQAFEPQLPQDVPNLPNPPAAAAPESLPPSQSPPRTINSGKTTEGTATTAINLRGIWKGGSYCPYLMNTYAAFSANVIDQGQNTFSGTFDFLNTPFRGTIRGDQITLEYHIGAQLEGLEQRWDGRITRVAGGLKMAGTSAVVGATNPPCSFELYKQ
jgi:hypothetical protein